MHNSILGVGDVIWSVWSIWSLIWSKRVILSEWRVCWQTVTAASIPYHKAALNPRRQHHLYAFSLGMVHRSAKLLRCNHQVIRMLEQPMAQRPNNTSKTSWNTFEKSALLFLPIFTQNILGQSMLVGSPQLVFRPL